VSVTIIINPISGGARPDTAPAKAQLALAVVETHGDRPEVFVTEGVGHARELARTAVARGMRLVMAWGGDGTINEVASALVFDEVPLGIIPAGSGNGLARELGVALRPERAIADALAAEPRPMDVGEIEGRYFVNIAGIGFDAHVASRFATARRRGFLGYAGITARALTSYVAQTYRISSGDTRQDVRAVLVTIANSAQFGNGALTRLFNGTVAKIAGCRLTRIRHVTIQADRPMMFHVDGEPVAGGTRLRARVHPGALRVAVK
jgi:diacylglycerol kinase family enzyme